MTLNTLRTLVDIVVNSTSENKDAILAELNKELNRNAERLARKAEEYDSAKGVVFATLAQATAPVTIAELFDACENEFPEGFTKGKLSYALSHNLWDGIVKIEGKVNAYTLA